MVKEILGAVLYLVVGFLFAVLNSWVVDAFETRKQVGVFILFWPLIVFGEFVMMASWLVWMKCKEWFA